MEEAFCNHLRRETDGGYVNENSEDKDDIMSTLIPDTEDTRYQLQRKARLEMIVKLENDILMDMNVCMVEGWDKTEYIRQLQDLLNEFKL